MTTEHKRWAIGDFDTGGGPQEQTLITAGADRETIILSLLISNYSSSDDAAVTIEHEDGSSNSLFTINLNIPAGLSPMAIDSKIVLETGDVIKATSAIDDVSILASGQEISTA